MLECKKRHIKLSKIKIHDEFVKCNPSPNKVIFKTLDYLIHDHLDKIYIDNNNNLIDGYIPYLILKELGANRIKVVKVKNKSPKRMKEGD